VLKGGVAVAEATAADCLLTLLDMGLLLLRIGRFQLMEELLKARGVRVGLLSAEARCRHLRQIMAS
jgi:hypothetical protein